LAGEEFVPWLAAAGELTAAFLVRNPWKARPEVRLLFAFWNTVKGNLFRVDTGQRECEVDNRGDDLLH
jgi:hypothetical protein